MTGSFGALQSDWTALALLAFAFILFLAEIKVVSHGILATLGLIAFAFGGLLLLQGGATLFALAVLMVAGAMGAYSFVSIRAVMRAQRQPVITGREGLVGSIGEVRTPIQAAGAEGIVLVAGELWKARAPVPLAEGSAVRVVAVRGLNLDVVPEQSVLDADGLIEP